jgi:hypothetical protein
LAPGSSPRQGLNFNGDTIVVADFYNHRVQVFDINGKVLNIIGEKDGFNVASAITFIKDGFAVTDQENYRVLIYDFNGKLLQILSDNKLNITNFKENSISVYK